MPISMITLGRCWQDLETSQMFARFDESKLCFRECHSLREFKGLLVHFTELKLNTFCYL